jgi:hypothetical protein
MVNRYQNNYSSESDINNSKGSNYFRDPISNFQYIEKQKTTFYLFNDFLKILSIYKN